MYIRKVAKRTARGDDKRAEDLFQIGMVIVCEVAPTATTRDVSAFMLQHYLRIRGAMLDALRGESRARRLDRAIMRGLEPISAQVEEGDFFAPAEERNQHRGVVAARMVATGLIAMAFVSGPETPEDALIDHSTQQHMHALVREAVRTELQPEEWQLVEEIVVKKIPMQVAADARGVTKSTVSRRVAASIDVLAKKIKRRMG